MTDREIADEIVEAVLEGRPVVLDLGEPKVQQGPPIPTWHDWGWRSAEGYAVCRRCMYHENERGLPPKCGWTDRRIERAFRRCFVALCCGLVVVGLRCMGSI